MAKSWLNCMISPGQFSGEFAVRGTMFDDTEFSLFVPKECLEFEGEPSEEKPVHGRITVSINESKDDLFLVSLPRPTFENGRSVTVKKGQLQTA